ncbi:MAG TPA: TrmO family methyltransferase [Bacteroidales bacterium]|nr:TrmO family methyltransferase [Bacteroidales bacterium]
MITIKPIGIVRNDFVEPADPFEMVKHQSRIVIYPEFSEGLYKIEQSEFIDITFHFHKSEGYRLKGPIYDGEFKGVFASRSPRRPNALGNTTVKLIAREGNELIVKGLDAINDTPVLDIKPCNISFYKEHGETIDINRLKFSPRWNITRCIRTNDLDTLLLKAAMLHGHFCPGLTMGVMVATYAMQKIRKLSDGMEDLIAITETNNCFSDGIQFVTGCTFGNNALIFNDLGKNAFTLTTRNRKGIRIVARNDSGDYLRQQHPLFYSYFQKVVVERNHDPELLTKFRKYGIETSFAMLHFDFSKIFNVKEVTTELPQYAPIHDSIICSVCGENAMDTRILEQDHSPVCLACAKKPFGQLTGHGILIEEMNN